MGLIEKTCTIISTKLRLLSINNKMRIMDMEIRETENKILNISKALNSLHNNFEKVISQLDNIQENISNVENKYGAIVSDLKNKLEKSERKRDVKIAVFLHLYYLDMWPEMKAYLRNIHYDYDLYVSVVNNSAHPINLTNMKSTIEKDILGSTVFIVENKGLDIGGTMVIMDHILNSDLNYDYVLKLHTKKSIHGGRESKIENGNRWRNQLIQPIVGNYKNVNSIIDLFTNDSSVGMIGANNWLLDKYNSVSFYDSPELKQYCQKLGIITSLGDIQFIGGTMFWVDFNVLKSFFTVNNPMKIRNNLESGAFTDMKGITRTHCFERVFGLMVLDSGKKIIGV
jgi:lipopolysaccharide biosynthesis protein